MFKPVWNEIINGFDFAPLLRILYSAIPALICITLHELSHGAVAFLLGDPTAKNAGRLTLNPIRHLDIMGFLMLVVARVGWAKPVPVDMRYFKHPKRGMALTALAGPLSNILIAAVFLLLFGFCFPFVSYSQNGTMRVICELLYLTAQLSVGLALFNLLPIPPLDGSKVLFSVMPDKGYLWLMRYERYGMLLLIALAYAGVTGRFLGVAIDKLVSWLMPLAEWGYRLCLSFNFV